MDAQLAQFTNRGMNQDISISKSSNEFAYRNYNIRISTIKDNTLLSVSNEKGPLELSDIEIVNYKSDTISNSIEGVLIGYSVLNDYIVLFTKTIKPNIDVDSDRIYRITIDSNLKINGKELFKGNLNFSEVSHIETLPFYESERVQKIYWVDGINYTRVINIVNEKDYDSNVDFDFVKIVDKYPVVSVNKKYTGTGIFPSGVIQYFISYYNKFGSETNLVWASDLIYITKYNKGISPEENVVCSFNINIKNINTSFDYIRLYSVIRTSINSTPIVKVVTDIDISSVDANQDTEINYIDTNTTGYDISIDNLLYLGLNKFTATTIEQKDNTLFLGNIEIKNNEVFSTELRNFVKENSSISWNLKSISNSDFQLNLSESDIKTFKFGETYRFAIQFQDETSNWSEPIWIGDYRCVEKPSVNTSTNEILLPTASVTINGDIASQFYNYKNWRVLIANPTFNDRKILAQGLVNPTIFNPYYRITGTGPYAIASPIARVRNSNVRSMHLEGLGSISQTAYDEKAEIQGIYNKTPVSPSDVNPGDSYFLINIKIDKNQSRYHLDIIKLKQNYENLTTLTITQDDIDSIIIQNAIFEYDKFDYLIWSIKTALKTDNINKLTKDNLELYIDNSNNYGGYSTISEIDNLWCSGYFTINGSEIIKSHNASEDPSTIGLYTIIKTKEPDELLFKDYVNNYYIDESIVSLYSPEIEGNEYLFESDLKFRIIGCININSSNLDAVLQVDPAGFSQESTFLKSKIVNPYNNKSTLINGFLFRDYGWASNNKLLKDLSDYSVYMWNKKGSIIGQLSDSSDPDGTKLTTTYANLKHKIFATRRYSNNTKYLANGNMVSYDVKPKVFNSDEQTLKSLDINGNTKTYSGNYDSILSFSNDSKYSIFFKRTNGTIAGKNDQLDPINIKFNTTKHLVFNLGLDAGNINLLPYNGLYSGSTPYVVSNIYPDIKDNRYDIPWEEKGKKYVMKRIVKGFPPSEYLFLGEVYRDIDKSVLYGGTSEEALKNNEWIPASDSSVLDINNPDSFTIDKTYGDTYYQRYDCLLSYPTTEEDINSVVDITSFMVETHKNLNGRYDANTDGFNLLNVRNTNFNQINPIYSQQNNLFTYKILDSKFNETKYGNQFAFSLTKSSLSDIDNWTKISTANSIGLDGVYGTLTKIIKLNNTLIAFQDKAISQINFNSRVALSTESGASVLLANSNKVDSTTIITNTTGCKNIKSICQTNTGIYFIDDNKKTLLRINKDGINNISSQGLTLWFKENLTGDELITYDSVTHDVYISNKNSCVVYNEDLQTFTSFYDYQNMQGLININSKSLLLYNRGSLRTILYSMFDGYYNSTVKENKYNGYEIQYKVNPEPNNDKIFTNIEYIADSFTYNKNINDADSINNRLPAPFLQLDVWNEYQFGTTEISTKFKYPNFINKFRIWRVDIPRDKNNPRNRIRNPWVFIKLYNSTQVNYKMVFHNLLVKYYR